jgi:DNA adenine methylase
MVRKLFGRMGGKAYSAGAIIAMMPEHTTYVEPFVGGGSVYFKKEPSEREVIADTDKQLIDVYKAVKSVPAKDLEDFEYSPSREKFNRLLKSNPRSAKDKFHRYAYINYFSFGTMNKAYNSRRMVANPGLRGEKFFRMEAYKERMKNTTIKHQGYEATIRQYDSPSTFFYLDPPYYNASRESYEGMNENFDWDKFAQVVKGIKGKWILSSNPDAYVRQLFKGYKIRTVSLTRTLTKGAVPHPAKPFKELLISNF